MSSWFSSDEDTGVSESSLHPVRVIPEPIVVTPIGVHTPVVHEYEDSDSYWGEDCPKYEDPDDPWYKEPEVVLGALSLAGAVVLLIVVLLSIKFRER